MSYCVEFGLRGGAHTDNLVHGGLPQNNTEREQTESIGKMTLILSASQNYLEPTDLQAHNCGRCQNENRR